MAESGSEHPGSRPGSAPTAHPDTPSLASPHRQRRRLAAPHAGRQHAQLKTAELLGSLHDRRQRLCQALRADLRNREALRQLRELDGQLALARDRLAHRADTVSVVAPSPASRARLGRVGVALTVVALLVILGGIAGQAWMRNGTGASAPVPGPALSPAPSASPTATATPSTVQRITERIPDLERLWASRDWAGAAQLLAEIAVLDASFPGLEAAWCDTYLHWAFDSVERADVQTAHSLYWQAYAVCDDQVTVRTGQSLSLWYLTGKWRYEHQYWEQAVQALQAVHDADPDYAQTPTMLHASYVAWGKAALSRGQPDLAQQAFRSALEVKPDDPEAAALLREILARPTITPTPVPRSASGKRIEVNISQQRMYVWQGDVLLYKWVCSTGEPGRNTAAGRFQVLSKIPEAWASTWRLRMPYWLGIYQAGTLENGIHALPILPDGQTLWGGYLGTPVSYGCVILSTENARTLYHWAEVGTPVWIHY